MAFPKRLIPALVLLGVYVLLWLPFVGEFICAVVFHAVLHTMDHYGNIGIAVVVLFLPGMVAALLIALLLQDWWMAADFALMALIGKKLFSH